MTELISHASKVMLKILQAKIQQYMNRELSDVQAGFRKGRRTRDQIANIHWIIENAIELKIKKKKNNNPSNSASLTTLQPCHCDCVDHNKLENSQRDRNTKTSYLPHEKRVCRSRSKS